MLQPFFILWICCFWKVNALDLLADVNSHHLIDESGRVRIFHGVNVVQKLPPYHPRLDKYDPFSSLVEKDFEHLKNWGMNVIRLGVMWPGVEPKRDEYNQTYLNTMKELVTKLGENGIYTMVDFHQDLFSGYFCGEGVPDYIVNMLRPLKKECNSGIGPLASKLGLCKGFNEYNYKIESKTGYPNQEQCLQQLFTDYYMSPEVSSAFDNFFNSKEATDRMAKYFEKLAQTFSDSPYVIGYDLINEPFVGDVYNKPYLLRAGRGDLDYLQPLYHKIQKAIRKYDQKKIIYYEANQFPGTLPLFDGIVNRIGFTELPGGNTYANRSVLSYHIYCCASGQNSCDHSTGDVHESKSNICDSYVQRKFDQRIIDFKKLGGGGFLSEFGACSNSKSCVDEINRNTRAADREFQSWAYWQYKYNDDITTQSGIKEGFFHEDGSIQELKLNALVRSYAQAIDGKPEEMIYYENTKEFELKYETNDQRNGITEIYTVQNSKERKINVKMGQVEISTSGEHIVLIKHPKGKKQKIHIEITSSTNSTSPTTLAPTTPSPTHNKC